ncbi:MAG: glycosyltransferase [Bacteroidetes bacterium]|nr:MAG: glycosyltransferase [Bacteroidota bacterium]
MKSKTIVYYGGFRIPDRNAAALRVRSISKMLLNHGCRVVLISKLSNHERLEDMPREIDGCEVYYTRDSLLNELKYTLSSKKLWDLLVDLRIMPDLIIGYNIPSLTTRSIIKQCRRKQVSYIADATEWATFNSFSIKNILKNLDTNYRMKHANFKANGIIAISSLIKDYYADKIDNVIQIPPIIEKQKRDVSSVSRPLLLCYVGSPGGGHKDRLDLIIDFYEKLNPDVYIEKSLVIVGATQDEYMKIYSKAYVPAGVIFKGRLPREEALKVLRKSSYSIFFRKSSRLNNAGFPTKFAESISYGVPVITNSTSDLERLILEEKFGVLVDLETLDLEESDSDLQTIQPELRDNCWKTNVFSQSAYMSELELFLKRLNR